MKNWMFAACALLLFAVAGCTKYTTPRKVSKRIVDGSWTITSFTIDGESVASQYAGYTFGFGESGSVIVKASAIGLSESGSWEVGLNKNPAILYLSFAPVGGLEYLADDWQVVEMQKNLMRLKRNDSSGASGSLTFKK